MPEQIDDKGITLPVIITGIRPQKKRDGRFSLFHGDQFIIGVSADTLIRFNLNRGIEITDKLFRQLSDEEEYASVKDYFLRLLGRRSHSGEELRTKAAGKGYKKDQINSVLDELGRKNYFSDDEFARRFVMDKLTINRWGPLKISSELTHKGVDRRIIEKVLADLTDDLQLKQICVDLALKRKRHFSRENDTLKRKQKIAAYLQQRGFSHKTIRRALPDISSGIND